MTREQVFEAGQFVTGLAALSIALKYKILLRAEEIGGTALVIDLSNQLGWYTETSARTLASALRGARPAIEAAEAKGVALSTSDVRALSTLRDEPDRQRAVIEAVADGVVPQRGIVAEVNGRDMTEQRGIDLLQRAVYAIEELYTASPEHFARAIQFAAEIELRSAREVGLSSGQAEQMGDRIIAAMMQLADRGHVDILKRIQSAVGIALT